MFELSWVELVGYLASALVVASLAMASIVRLRTISLVASITFVAYGVLIESFPIVLTNVAVGALNIWYLRQELGMKRDLGASLLPPEAPFLEDFLASHLEDILHFQPEAHIPGEDPFALLLTRDGMPAGVLAGRRRGDELEVTLDHVLRPYRDSRLGNWLFGPGSDVFRQLGITRITSLPGSEPHRHYLEGVGFTRDSDRYVLELNPR